MMGNTRHALTRASADSGLRWLRRRPVPTVSHRYDGGDRPRAASHRQAAAVGTGHQPEA